MFLKLLDMYIQKVRKGSPFQIKWMEYAGMGQLPFKRRSIMSQGFECLISLKVLPEEWSHLDKVQNGWSNDKINQIDNVLDMKPTQATAVSRLFIMMFSWKYDKHVMWEKKRLAFDNSPTQSSQSSQGTPYLHYWIGPPTSSFFWAPKVSLTTENPKHGQAFLHGFFGLAQKKSLASCSTEWVFFLNCIKY